MAAPPSARPTLGSMLPRGTSATPPTPLVLPHNDSRIEDQAQQPDLLHNHDDPSPLALFEGRQILVPFPKHTRQVSVEIPFQPACHVDGLGTSNRSPRTQPSPLCIRRSCFTDRRMLTFFTLGQSHLHHAAHTTHSA